MFVVNYETPAVPGLVSLSRSARVLRVSDVKGLAQAAYL
jgi:hypothetical protein